MTTSIWTILEVPDISVNGQELDGHQFVLNQRIVLDGHQVVDRRLYNSDYILRWTSSFYSSFSSNSLQHPLFAAILCTDNSPLLDIVFLFFLSPSFSTFLCRIILASADDFEKCPCHFSLCCFTVDSSIFKTKLFLFPLPIGGVVFVGDVSPGAFHLRGRNSLWLSPVCCQSWSHIPIRR